MPIPRGSTFFCRELFWVVISLFHEFYNEKIRKNGFTITERYSPEDVAEMINGVCSRDVNSLGLDPEEQKAFEKYVEANKKYIKGH